MKNWLVASAFLLNAVILALIAWWILFQGIPIKNDLEELKTAKARQNAAKAPAATEKEEPTKSKENAQVEELVARADVLLREDKVEEALGLLDQSLAVKETAAGHLKKAEALRKKGEQAKAMEATLAAARLLSSPPKE